MQFEDFVCPLLNRTLDVLECFDVAMVAEDGAPDRTLPAELRDKGLTQEQKETCLKCKFHVE